MERTLSVNYPVLRQSKRVLLNMFVKTTVIRFPSCNHGVFQTYSIKHPYFALVQGSLH